jgi:hypothetical protein
MIFTLWIHWILSLFTRVKEPCEKELPNMAFHGKPEVIPIPEEVETEDMKLQKLIYKIHHYGILSDDDYEYLRGLSDNKLVECIRSYK